MIMTMNVGELFLLLGQVSTGSTETVNTSPTSILVPILIGAITFAICFYIKDYLHKRSEYSKLRRRLEKVAGKGAKVIYSAGSGTSPGMGPQVYKVLEINEHGVTLENELQRIYVPPAKMVQSEMILPCEDYDRARFQKIKKDMEELADVMIPAIFKKMIPAIRETMLEDMGEEDGEFAAVIGIQVKKALSEKGMEIHRKQNLPAKESDNA